MDTKTLSITVAIVAAALALLTVLLAITRKERGLTVYALGFASGMISFLLFWGQGILNPWIGFILANMLVVFFHLCLAWGLRLTLAWPRPWPRRFGVYLGLWLGVLVAGTFVWNSYVFRACFSSVFVILFTVEFLLAQALAGGRLPLVIRRTAWAVGLAFIGFHAVRLVLILGQMGSSSTLMVDNLVSNYTFAFTIFVSILWAGLILAIDAALLLGQLSDKNEQLRTLATTDELTGVSNRHQLEAKLSSELERAGRYHQPLSLIMFDIDHFKQVNDCWGHPAGDQVLKGIAQAARKLIREPDSLFRWGGEEFIILAPHTSLEGASVLADKVRLAIQSIVFPGMGKVSASFGVAEWRPGDKRDLWFKHVDQALYRAKNNGRNQVVCFGRNEALPIAHVRLDWQQDWECGNETIDGQHRALLEMANELLDLSLSGAGTDGVVKQLDALLAHVVKHFAVEEAILEKLAYPELKSHAQQHGVLVKEALALREATASGLSDAGTFFNFLVNRVVIGHLLQADVLFFPFIRSADKT